MTIQKRHCRSDVVKVKYRKGSHSCLKLIFPWQRKYAATRDAPLLAHNPDLLSTDQRRGVMVASSTVRLAALVATRSREPNALHHHEARSIRWRMTFEG